MKVSSNWIVRALLMVGLVGCNSSSYGTICEKMQQCSGGNDMDVDACVAQGDAASSVAAAYDCSDQFSKLTSCYEAKGTCDNGHFEADCSDEQSALSRCEDAASDIKGGSVGGGGNGGGCVALCAELASCTSISEGECMAQMEAAGATDEVCSVGLGTACSGSTCTSDGSYCELDSECCNGYCDQNSFVCGASTCTSEGGYCELDSECCSGYCDPVDFFCY